MKTPEQTLENMIAALKIKIRHAEQAIAVSNAEISAYQTALSLFKDTTRSVDDERRSATS